jgi:hypothetical protein
VQLTVVVPTTKTPPLAGTQVGVTAPQLSVAVTVNVTMEPAGPVQSTTTLAGQFTTGGVVSLTRIVCVQLAPFPQPSTADHVRVMVLLAELPGALCTSV